jgi:hypothetical protein
MGSSRSPWFSVSAIVLYVLFFLQTIAAVFYYIGWMNNYVYTIPPLTLMILTIVQTSLYLVAWVFFFLRMIPYDIFGMFKGNSKELWSSMQCSQATAHVGVTFILSAAGLVMAAVWYGKYNGSIGKPNWSDEDAYTWYKMILLWMTVVWGLELSRLFMLISNWQFMVEAAKGQLAAAALIKNRA